MTSTKILFVFTLLTIICLICDALECYVCHEQENNIEKCTKSIKTCEQGEDVCVSEIRWGSTPYWSQGALKQYYVSKRCASRASCIAERQGNMPYCTHIWYEDWACSECCQGDRCNYYIISGGESIKHHSSLLLLPAVTLLSAVFFGWS